MKIGILVSAAITCCVLGTILSPSSGAQACDATKIMAQMDTAAAKFQSTQADFKWDVLQAVVSEHDVQSGTIYFDRKGSTTSMAAYIKQPADKTVFYGGGTLTLLQPEIKQETLFKASGQYESFLTLGFGGSGKDLDSNWTVTCQGMEAIDGVQTAKLDLKPKQANVAGMFAHVTVWIDPARSLSLKQIFYEASGDTRTATYDNIKYNAKIPADMFKPKDKGYSIIRK